MMTTILEKPKSLTDTKLQESALPDEELLVRYRDTGDRDLFARLVHRYERELFSYLRRYLGDAELAEDVFQAAFLQVHLKCEQFQEGRRFRPWLYTIATNQAIDARRRNKRHIAVSLDRTGGSENGDDLCRLIDLLEASECDPLERMDVFEQRERVRQTLDELPEPMQTVIHLVYYQGLKYREAAEILAVPLGTVKSRLHAAILKLTETWKNTHTNQT